MRVALQRFRGVQTGLSWSGSVSTLQSTLHQALQQLRSFSDDAQDSHEGKSVSSVPDIDPDTMSAGQLKQLLEQSLQQKFADMAEGIEPEEPPIIDPYTGHPVAWAPDPADITEYVGGEQVEPKPHRKKFKRPFWKEPLHQRFGSYDGVADEVSDELEAAPLFPESRGMLYDLRTAYPEALDADDPDILEVTEELMEDKDFLQNWNALNEAYLPPYPGARPILKWTVHYLMEAAPADVTIPKNRKARCEFYLRDLQEQAGLSEDAIQHLARVLGPRYRETSGKVVMSCERYRHREDNRRWIVARIEDLVREGIRAFPTGKEDEAPFAHRMRMRAQILAAEEAEEQAKAEARKQQLEEWLQNPENALLMTQDEIEARVQQEDPEGFKERMLEQATLGYPEGWQKAVYGNDYPLRESLPVGTANLAALPGGEDEDSPESADASGNAPSAGFVQESEHGSELRSSSSMDETAVSAAAEGGATASEGLSQLDAAANAAGSAEANLVGEAGAQEGAEEGAEAPPGGSGVGDGGSSGAEELEGAARGVESAGEQAGAGAAQAADGDNSQPRKNHPTSS